MSKKLLFQSDDYGITDAVTDGIIHGIRNGVIRNTGIFINMDSTARAVHVIRDIKKVCLGIDINYVCGKPVSDPSLIPDLVDKDGCFISSRELLKKNRIVSMEKDIIYHFEKDPYPFEQIYLETENQVKKFISMTGKLPRYLHPHSICTPNSEKAAADVAKKYGIFHSTDMMFSSQYVRLPGAINNTKGATLESQMDIDVEKNLLETALPILKEGDIGYFICHCGYIDYDLFKYSSLTLRRAVDLYAAASKKVSDYINENDIELITYDDLSKLEI